MRILHTVGFYHPDNGGGAQEVVRQISERLAARGHNITVATTFSNKRTNFEIRGVKIKQFSIHGLLNQSILGIYGDINAYLNDLVNSNYDVIMNYAAQTWCTDLTFRVLPQLSARTILAACGFSGLIPPRKYLYLNYFKQLPQYLKQYSTIVYHSENYIDKLFGDKNGIRNYKVIPNGVDTDEFTRSNVDFRNLYGIRTKYFLLSVGNHFQNKGHKRLIKAFDASGRKDATLVIIGNPSNSLRSCWNECKQAESLHNGNLVILNNIPRDHVISAFKQADIFLSGSFVEAFPLCIIEAMAGKTPFITFPSGNVSELAGGIVTNSSFEMLQSINELLDDHAKRLDLGLTGYKQQIEKYDWEKIVDCYEAVYTGAQ